MNPDRIPAIHRKLKQAFENHQAPIIDLMQAQGADPFHILVATLLSARTKDGTTADACRRLFAVVKRPQDLRELPQAELERLIYPVGFYRTKSRHLKQLPEVLDRDFGGKIPETIEALCQLPGVGRKTANLVLIAAFDRHGMCVDTHVHRISNRMGLIRTQTPTESEKALRQVLPKRYWKTWNRQLVSHGQMTCKPMRPDCGTCVIRSDCERIGLR